MSAPFRETVTLYHHEGGAWTRVVLRGVAWRQRLLREADASGAPHCRAVTRVTVPRAAWPQARFGVEGLDALVRGECARTVSADYPLDALKRDEPSFCIVQAIADNTHRGALPHWRLIAR